MKPRQPPRIARSEGRCQFQQAKSLGDVSGSPIPDLCSQQAEVFFVRTRNRKEFRSDGTQHPQLQGVRPPRTRSRRTTSASGASARSRSPTTTPGFDPAEAKRKIQAGPGDIWRYADFLPLAERPRDPLQPGLTPLLRADRLAERLGPRRGLDQERRRQPDPLVQGPGRRRRAGEGARARLRDRRLRLDRQPRQRGRRPRGGGRARLLRLRPRRPRGAEAARDRRLRHPAGRRQGQLRRRQPALHRALRASGRGRS